MYAPPQSKGICTRLARNMDMAVAAAVSRTVLGERIGPVSLRSLRRLNPKLSKWVTRKLKKYPSIPYTGRSKNSSATSIEEVIIL